MSKYAKYKFVLKLTATGKTGMELSGAISEFAKDAILKAIWTDEDDLNNTRFKADYRYDQKKNT